MNWWIEDFMGSMYRVCDDDYTINIGDLNSLISTTSNGKKFGFYDSNIDYMV